MPRKEIVSAVEVNPCVSSQCSEVRVIDATAAPVGVATMQLSTEDIAGLMGMRCAKCQIAPANPGKKWQMRLSVQRPALPTQPFINYELGPNPDPFLIAYKKPAAGAPNLEFFHAYNWDVTLREVLDNPPSYFVGLRGTTSPLTSGCYVVMLWQNEGGHGWDPACNDYVQRVVMDLKEF